MITRCNNKFLLTGTSGPVRGAGCCGGLYRFYNFGPPALLAGLAATHCAPDRGSEGTGGSEDSCGGGEGGAGKQGQGRVGKQGAGIKR